MEMSKKGFVFSVISIFIVALAVMMFSVNPVSTIRQDPETIETVVSLTNDFVRDVKMSFLPGVVRNSAKSAFFIMVMKINDTGYGPYGDDVERVFQELITNGTIWRNYVPEMDNRTILNYTDRLLTMSSNQLGIDINLSIMDVSISQQGPYHVLVDVDFFLAFNNSRTTFRYDSFSVPVNVSLEGLYDPVWRQFTPGHCYKEIRFTVLEEDDSVTPCHFSEWVYNKTFVHMNLSPSFLQRMRGDWDSLRLNSSCCGVQAVISSDDWADLDCSPGGRLQTDYPNAVSGSSYADTYYLQNDSICTPTRFVYLVKQFNDGSCHYGLPAVEPYWTVRLNLNQTSFFDMTSPLYTQNGCP
jgi:hypothetical protein